MGGTREHFPINTNGGGLHELNFYMGKIGHNELKWRWGVSVNLINTPCIYGTMITLSTNNSLFELVPLEGGVELGGNYVENWVPGPNKRSQWFDNGVFYFPTLGEPIGFRDTMDGKVLVINGRNYKIHLGLKYEDGFPQGGEISFEPTILPPSVGIPTLNSHYFGQPRFRQGPLFPVFNGKISYPLLTLQTGWGDCGTENIFVGLDNDGIPTALFHESNSA